MHQEKFKNILFLRMINPIVRLLIVSDIMFIMSRIGLIAPIFAIFITNRIEGGNLEVIGIATSIFLISKSLLQIPASIVFDRIKGEKDDFWAIFAGTLTMSILPLLYIFVDSILSLYLTQFIYGLAAAIAYPPWMAVFTRHIDKEHEGVEWSMYFTLTDLATALAAVFGGIIAYRYGFNYLFIIASLISFFGMIVLLGVKKLVKI